MRGRTLLYGRDAPVTALLIAVLLGGVSSAGVSEPVRVAGSNTCRRGVLDGEVRAGESFARPLGGGLQVRLEALSWGSGWLLRISPVGTPRLGHDYAELATPPYSSVNPLLISTDYSFRSQDVVAWNPRRFRFATSAAEFARIESVFERYARVSPPPPALEVELASLVSKASEGTLEIMDARLIPGTANQSKMAAVVASHFDTTVHTVEEPRNGTGSVLGRLTWMRFKLSLDLPRGFKADPALLVETSRCR